MGGDRLAASLIERALWAGLMLAAVAAGLLAARNGLVPAQRPLTFGLVFGGYFAAGYVVPALAVAGALIAAAGLVGRPVLARPALALATLALLGLAFARNSRAARMAFDLGGPERFRLLLPVALVAAASALVLLALAGLAEARPAGAGFVRRARLVGAARTAALVALACAFAALAPPAWLRFGGARPVPTANGASAAPRPARLSPLPPLFVIGLDGADWRYVEPLLQRGELPHLAELRRRGAWGPLATFEPTLSPVIWTTIATGRPPFRHGIAGFTTPRLRGVEDSLPGLHPLRGLGFGPLWRWLERSGRIRQAPVTSRDRRVPAAWNLAGEARAPVALVNWWATWPAEPVFGYVVSERAYAQGQRRGRATPPDHGLTYPPELYRQIAPEIVRYDEVTYAAARAFMDVSEPEFADTLSVGRGHPADVVREFPYFLSLFETTRRHALSLVERGRRTWGVTPDLMTIFRFLDQNSHTALGYSELVDEHLGATDEERRRFGRVVSEAYRRADRVVGELVAACGRPCNVIVLSDHGFQVEEFPGGLRKYHHSSAPPGILLAAGPAFRPGRVDGVSVYDVLPLVAYLKGLPVARDLNGRLPENLIAPALLAAQPVRTVESYGTRAAPADLAIGSEAVDEEMLQRLRALGYIQ